MNASTPTRTRLFALVVAVLAIAALLAGSFGGPGRSAQAAPAQPNVVVVYTDDQRWDDTVAMPTLQRELVGKGVRFTNGFVVNPWCCPSRATLLTGQYSHSTGVYRNSGAYGGFNAFRDSSTLATALRGAGYRTSLVGKYLNGYNSTYVPPGWTDWHAFSGTLEGSGGAYYNYSLNENGALRSFGSAPADYSTDVLAGRAESFIRSTPSTDPLFLLFTPFAPHGAKTAPDGEAIPAPRHLGTLEDQPIARRGNVNEADVSDKPAWVRALPRLTAAQLAVQDRAHVRARESLRSVDDAIGRLLDALADTGRLSNTLIVFQGDNGMSFGEHRFVGKQAAYEEIARVPLVVRYDPAGTAPRTSSRLALNLDIAPTVTQLAGATLPGMEGRSLVPVLNGTVTGWRSDFLIEHLKGFAGDPVPSYCAVRTTNRTYVRYSTGEQELYDLKLDKLQLVNRATDPAYGADLSRLAARARTLCNPPPPGYSF